MAEKHQPNTGHGRSGLILGKFMPPHRGHLFLIDFARHYVDHLTVLVCSIDREPIPGELRYRWMREACPGVNLVHITDDLPQEPADHPSFWHIWHDRIRQAMPSGPDYVFASEDYGWKLADVLGSQYIPVDHARKVVPVSGTLIRNDPMRYWDMLPEYVRPHYVKRVCLFGPESTGKSTLSEKLANHYQTVHAWEYARSLLDFNQGKATAEDIPKIARGQMATEDALASQANRVLFCDTDLITTTIWSDVLFNRCPAWILEEADRRSYDLYLLMDIDTPWVNDNQRFLGEPAQRRSFFERCKHELEIRNRPYVLIQGDWGARMKQAVEAVDRLIATSIET